ncbi:MAG: hypothetical protein ACOYMB_00130 [Patescibacteria group bacterium]
MKRKQKIRYIFDSFKNILAKYQVGRLYETQINTMVDCLIGLSPFLTEKERLYFEQEVKKMQDHFLAFSSDNKFKMFIEMIEKGLAEASPESQTNFSSFFKDGFLNKFKFIKKDLGERNQAEEILRNIFFLKKAIN